jgi:hypothetical protein
VLDGSALLSRELDLGLTILDNSFKGCKLGFQYWPRDMQIRRNMVCSKPHAGWEFQVVFPQINLLERVSSSGKDFFYEKRIVTRDFPPLVLSLNDFILMLRYL